MKDINDNNFKEETSNGIVIIDLYADWCGPCRALTPILEELSGKMTDVKFLKLDVDASPETTQMFGVMSIPTTIIMKDGKEVKRIVGLNPKSVYIDALEAVKA